MVVQRTFRERDFASQTLAVTRNAWFGCSLLLALQGEVCLQRHDVAWEFAPWGGNSGRTLINRALKGDEAAAPLRQNDAVALRT